MRKIYISMLFAFAGLSASYSQCNMIDVPLSERINTSTAIFEGKVVDKVSFWNSQHTNIFTANKIEIYKVFKGDISSTFVEIISEGGIVDDQMEIVTPSLDLSKDETGIFMAQQASTNNSPGNIQNHLKFETVASTEGFVKYDLIEQSAYDGFNKYTNIQEQLYNAISDQVGSSFKVVKPFNIDEASNNTNRNMLAPITSFSPTTINAGTLSVLTINGSGFGTSGTVSFKNADDGGATYINANAPNIVSWTDGQIQVRVPSKAGTGTIRVNSTVSTGTLTVTYNQMTAIDGSNVENRMKLRNHNTTGGYTFKFNTNFNTNTAAVAASNRAMETWRCATQRNMITSGTSSIGCQAKDGTNIISFDAGCVLGGNLLGKTFTYYDACSSGGTWYWTLTQIDIIFAAAAGGGVWNYGPGATTGGKYDFESTALHEWGHATLEGHVINAPKLMHWVRAANTDVRTLDAAIDIACGNEVVTRSITTNACGPTVMTKLGTSCITGITEEEANNNVTIYPNPFDNSAILHINNPGENVSVALYDVLGKEVKRITNIKNENVLISRDNLPDGIYFYLVKDNEKTIATGKVILANNN
ncbi:MAG: T9SS type A sorting domain-containing protein [Bacteroidota bacterium]